MNKSTIYRRANNEHPPVFLPDTTIIEVSPTRKNFHAAQIVHKQIIPRHRPTFPREVKTHFALELQKTLQSLEERLQFLEEIKQKLEYTYHLKREHINLWEEWVDRDIRYRNHLSEMEKKIEDDHSKLVAQIHAKIAELQETAHIALKKITTQKEYKNIKQSILTSMFASEDIITHLEQLKRDRLKKIKIYLEKTEEMGSIVTDTVIDAGNIGEKIENLLPQVSFTIKKLQSILHEQSNLRRKSIS